MTKKKIEIEVEELSGKALHLTQHLGNGTLGKTKFDACFVLPTMSLLVEVDKKKYLVDSQSLIKSIIDAHLRVKK